MRRGKTSGSSNSVWQQIIQNPRYYKENDKEKTSSMVDKGTYCQKEKIECLKKMLPEKEK
jgi:hypothetical protein